MDPLKDILSKRRALNDEPKEFKVIKSYIHSEMKIKVGLKSTSRSIIIYVPSPSAAGNLRYLLHTIKEKLQTDKDLVIKIK